MVQNLERWEKRQDIVEVQALYEAGKYVQSSKQWMEWKPQKRSCRQISKLSSYQWQRPSQAKKCSKKTTLHSQRKNKRTRYCCWLPFSVKFPANFISNHDGSFNVNFHFSFNKIYVHFKSKININIYVDVFCSTVHLSDKVKLPSLT